MAVVIASNLRKELGGSVLFDGVSFKVERGERLALSGPNGAGKTTLLRILAGQTELHGGELAFSKGTRIALHDQRPPLHLDLSLRDYVLGGAADLVALEQELRRLETAMGEGAHDAGDDAPLLGGASRGSSTPAAGTGARARPPSSAGSASRRPTSTAGSTRSRAAS